MYGFMYKMSEGFKISIYFDLHTHIIQHFFYDNPLFWISNFKVSPSNRP